MENSGGFKSIDYEPFKTIVYELLKNENNVIILDKFQRLPDDFTDILHFAKDKNAKRILLGSSMRTVKTFYHPEILFSVLQDL